MELKIYAQISATPVTNYGQEWNGRDGERFSTYTVESKSYTDFKACFYSLDHEGPVIERGRSTLPGDLYLKLIEEVPIEPSSELLRAIELLSGYQGYYYTDTDGKWYVKKAATTPLELDTPYNEWDDKENILMDELRAIWHEDLGYEKITPKKW